MHYLAILRGREGGPGSGPGSAEFEAEVARYAEFEAQAGQAIAGGAALYPSATAVTIRHAGDRALITDGPFTEQAEVVGGFYVFEADNLDDAIQLARRVPAAEVGAIEVRPMVMWDAPAEAPKSDWWMGLLWERPDQVIAPDTPEWTAAVAEHQAFAQKVGEVIRGGGAVHPPSTATTVRVREGQLLLTDGPFPEGAEVVDGLYLFTAPDRSTATEIATQIPCGEHGHLELRQLVDLGD